VIKAFDLRQWNSLAVSVTAVWLTVTIHVQPKCLPKQWYFLAGVPWRYNMENEIFVSFTTVYQGQIHCQS